MTLVAGAVLHERDASGFEVPPLSAIIPASLPPPPPPFPDPLLPLALLPLPVFPLVPPLPPAPVAPLPPVPVLRLLELDPLRPLLDEPWLPLEPLRLLLAVFPPLPLPVSSTGPELLLLLHAMISGRPSAVARMHERANFRRMVIHSEAGRTGTKKKKRRGDSPR